MGSITNILLVFFTWLVYFTHPIACLANASSNSGCVESEREALLKFKESEVHDDFNELSSWMGSDCCSWYGITCHDLTGHVQSLELKPFMGNFSSTFSPWLFNLSRVEILSLFGLRGPIPNMFEKLTTLIHLDLSWNSFESTLPDSLCSLISLQTFDVGWSHLQGSLPVCLGNMTSLTTLQLNNNKFSGDIPPTLGNLTKLGQLDVSENFLTGELTESFFERLENLWILSIHSNQFRLLNVSYQWIPSFQVHDILISNVYIGTQFPLWLQTQSIHHIFMSNVSISGGFPDWWFVSPGNLNLTYFDLSNNLLTGPVPTFNAINYASFQFLHLSGNQLTGTIPEELCSFTSLLQLSLASNQLIGAIPLCLGNLHNLVVLDLANNNLSGHIPSELGFFQNLLSLHLNGNNLSGELPSLQNLSLLTTLDLGENQLQGFIPEWIAKEYFPDLQFLRLESNFFSSEITASICQLPSLQILNLAHNNLFGTIPSCLGNLSKMLSYESGGTTRFFNYEDSLLNVIKGTKREYSSTLMYSKFISLSGNHLHGEIPAELMNLKGLQSLDLSNNELTGMIPKTIYNLTHLESLDLSLNRLSGTIPQSLAEIDGLSYLNLSFNNLAGMVPSGKHFDTLADPSIYEGNVGLCGKMIMKSCPGDDLLDGPAVSYANGDGDDDEFDQLSWMYAGIGPGFAVGFVAVICTLYFKDHWRIAYFGFVDNLYNRVWVTLTTKISQFRRKFNST